MTAKAESFEFGQIVWSTILIALIFYGFELFLTPYIIFRKPTTFYFLLNLVWILNLVLFGGLSYISYNQGQIKQQYTDLCINYDQNDLSKVEEDAKPHINETLAALTDTCIFQKDNNL